MIDTVGIEMHLDELTREELRDMVLGLDESVLADLFPDFIEDNCANCDCLTRRELLNRNGHCNECEDYIDNHATCDLCGELFELSHLDDGLCEDCSEPVIEEDEDQ